MVKNPPADAGDLGLIPGSGRSPGVRNGNPYQYSCRKIPWTEEPGELQFKWGCKELDATEHTHQIRSDQISCSVVSDSLRPHELQHARPPCPSPTPGVHPDSRPSSQ